MALADSVKHARSWRRIVITFPSHICYIWSRDTLARRAAQNCVASVQKICYNEFANWYICPIFERRKQMNRQFPRLEVDAGRIRSNAQQIAARCRARGIAVCGVIKGVNGLPEIVRTYKEAGIAELGTSRIEQIIRCREAGIEGPYLLIRIPGLSELPDVVRRLTAERARGARRARARVRAAGKNAQRHRHGRPRRPARGLLGPRGDGRNLPACGAGAAARASARRRRKSLVLRLHQAHAGKDERAD